MTRLTENIREKIARSAVEHKYTPIREALKLEENALAMECYSSIYPAEELAIVATLPKEWFRFCSCLRFNANGWKVELSTASEVPTHYAAYCHLLGDITGELAERVQAFSQRKEKMRDEARVALSEIEGFLSAFKSFKQLRDNWPEGAEFYSKYDVTREPSSLPAVRTAKINQMLGLAA